MVDKETAVDQEIRALVRQHATRHAAPAGLADRISDSLQAVSRPQARVPANSNWRPLAMAASLLLAVGLSSGATWFFAAADRQETMAQQVVASHVRSMLGDHLTDVASSDQHTVKPWFSGKLDLSPPVVDLTGQGFPLVGGRLDYLDKRPVAALVYRHSQHVINLFVCPETGARLAAAAPSSMQGYNIRQWREGDLSFWVVSDVNPSDLENFERILQTATR